MRPAIAAERANSPLSSVAAANTSARPSPSSSPAASPVCDEARMGRIAPQRARQTRPGRRLAAHRQLEAIELGEPAVEAGEVVELAKNGVDHAEAGARHAVAGRPSRWNSVERVLELASRGAGAHVREGAAVGDEQRAVGCATTSGGSHSSQAASVAWRPCFSKASACSRRWPSPRSSPCPRMKRRQRVLDLARVAKEASRPLLRVGADGFGQIARARGAAGIRAAADEDEDTAVFGPISSRTK